MGATNRRSQFGTNASRDPLSRTMGQRLLVLVGLLVLVLVLMQHARRPDTWQWLWQNGSSAADHPIDVKQSGNAHFAETTSSASSQYQRHPKIDERLLNTVQDDTFFRDEEQLAWFHLWDILLETPADEMQQHGVGPISYLQLYRQTSEYRGQFVTMRGTLRRAHRIAAPTNDLGLDSYWQAWLFPDQSDRPVVVYALAVESAATFQGQMQMERTAQVDGLVFKRWAYGAAEGLTVAPVVLAQRLTVLDRSPSETPAPAYGQRANLEHLPLLFAAASIAAILTTLYLYRYTANLGRRPSDNKPVDIQFPADNEL